MPVEGVGPLGAIFDDVDDVAEVDYVGWATLGVGTVRRIPTVNLETERAEMAEVIASPAAIVEHGVAVGDDDPVGEGLSDGTRE